MIYDGSVSYKNQLDNDNLPFFLASTGIFTSYGVSACILRKP